MMPRQLYTQAKQDVRINYASPNADLIMVLRRCIYYTTVSLYRTKYVRSEQD